VPFYEALRFLFRLAGGGLRSSEWAAGLRVRRRIAAGLKTGRSAFSMARMARMARAFHHRRKRAIALARPRTVTMLHMAARLYRSGRRRYNPLGTPT
jgi:hypothetical protein